MSRLQHVHTADKLLPVQSSNKPCPLDLLLTHSRGGFEDVMQFPYRARTICIQGAYATERKDHIKSLEMCGWEPICNIGCGMKEL